VAARKVKVAAGAKVLPYTRLVGQQQLKMALELSYIAPRIGGVLVSGERGTAKSTAVRAFALMVYGELPVTLPINATDDRVLGGWQIGDLMRGTAKKQPGLLEDAGNKGMLYVDEVNLLDDHIVNIILDSSSTGILTVQREGLDQELRVEFSLVGTMNPEEGLLRPQLLDRFGLMVDVGVETDVTARAEILRTVLMLDEAVAHPTSEFLQRGRKEDQVLKRRLDAARDRLYDVKVEDDVASLCAAIAARFQSAGHRGDIVMALAARALAAHEQAEQVAPAHVARVAQLALQHRRRETNQRGPGYWTGEDDNTLQELVAAGR
jgi:magnesium chelatase subunit I